jgi:GTPase SAR1 family protein
MNTTIAQQIANEGGVEAYLHAQQHKSLLRFLTCGSVDDGKSTLIGRLLHDTRQIYEDQLSTLHNDSKRHGTQGEKLDLACWSTACRQNVSRASPSTWRTVTSQPRSANLSLPTPRARTVHP